MKKTLKLFIIIFSVIFVLNFYACLAADKVMKKSEKFIEDNMYEKGNKASSSKDVAYYFRLEKQFSNRHDDEINNYYYNQGRKYAEILNTIKSKYKPYELSQYKNAVRMLAKYHGTGAVPALIEALKYCTWNHYKCCFQELGAEIIYYLGELKDKRAIPTLKWAIQQSVGGSTSNPSEWASNLATALIKLNAKECAPTIKEILIKFVEENSGAYWTMGGIRIKCLRPYLGPLTEFTGKPYEEINWEKVAKTVNRLSIFNLSVRATLGGLDDKKYPKYSEKLREITNPLNYEKIKKWVFLIKEWEKLPSWGPIRTKSSSYSWRAKYNLTMWNYGKVKLCDLKNNKIYLEVTRHPQGHHGQIIDASLITLTIKGDKIEVYDIQKGTTYQKAERETQSLLSQAESLEKETLGKYEIDRRIGGKLIKVILDNASIKATRAIGGKTIIRVPLNTILDAEIKQGDWYRISWKGVSGYIHAMNVEELK